MCRGMWPRNSKLRFLRSSNDRWTLRKGIARLSQGDLCRTYWKTFGRYWLQIMNVSKSLDKATSPCFTLGRRRGLLSLISHSMKVLKSRYQQAARHFFKVGNIYVGRALNVSRAVGSELRMTKLTLVERRMTKWATSTLVER